MSFAWPFLLWLLLAPLALLVWELTHRRRGAAAASAHPKIFQVEAGANSLTYSHLDAPASRRTRPRYWLCAGLVLAIVALARPQWGRIEEPVFDQSREILLAVDLSRSMLTPDVAPSRLDRAKLLIQALLEKLKGERVGLMVFSGTAFLQSPLSADYEILREFLPTLGPNYLPQGGSNYGALLDASIQAFASTGAADRFLVILSDGEATDEDWRSRMEELKKKNIRVLGLGVGTAAGAMIPDGADGFIKDERGAVVLSKLESATLQELARETNGVYRDASAWVDIAGLVRETVEAGQKGRFVETNTVRMVERFQWPLALALWCLLCSLCYEFPVRPRPRELKFAGAPEGQTPVAAKAVSAATTAAALLALGVLTYPISGFAAAALAKSDDTTPDAGAALTKIVGRLSGLDAPSARDWAELGRETVSWGTRLQSDQQPISEGPVRDALAGVDLGAKLDPKAAEWPKLREELEALLKKAEDENQSQQQQKQQQQQQQQQDPNQKPDQNKDQQNQQQSNDPNQNPPPQDPNNPEQQQQQQKNQQQQQQNNPQNNSQKNDEGPAPDEREAPPPGEMQKVGGSPEKKDNAPENSNPALAVPLQKLDQLRNQDSPARLFQLMEGAPKQQQKKSGKDW